jgi:hypothetical protein
MMRRDEGVLLLAVAKAICLHRSIILKSILAAGIS